MVRKTKLVLQEYNTGYLRMQKTLNKLNCNISLTQLIGQSQIQCIPPWLYSFVTIALYIKKIQWLYFALGS